MNFLKRLFSPGPPPDRALYVYVRPKMCQELLRVRVDMLNDLSQMEDGSGYFTRKLARGNRCPFPAELRLEFDRDRRLVNQTVENGEFVTQAEYEAWHSAEQ